MGKILDLTNKRFGKLKVISKTKKNNRVAWICQCDCGNETIVITNSLTSGNTKSCGCGLNCPNEIGKRYGKLTVIEKAQSKNNKSQWKCQCDCGKIIVVSGDCLHRGQVRSCGCLKIIDETGNKYFNLQVLSLENVKNGVAYWNCKCACGNQIVVAGSHLRSGHTKSCGCLKSSGEFKINQILLNNSINFKTQYTIKINNSYYRFDYAIFDDNNQLLKLIEFDGEQHFPEYENQYYNYQITHKRDLVKNQYCKNNGITLNRIPYWERNNLSLDLILGDQYKI